MVDGRRTGGDGFLFMSLCSVWWVEGDGTAGYGGADGRAACEKNTASMVSKASES